MHLDDKGIASAELLFVSLIFLVIAGGLINLANSEMGIIQTGELGEARMIGENLAEVVNTVYINGNGYSINMTLPNDFSYSAYISTTGQIIMGYNNQNITIKTIPVDKIYLNNASPITNGTFITVSNVNGTIQIN